MEVLAEMQDKYNNVIIEGGNAYALPYGTDALNIPLDNSRYQISSASIPFIGMVLHGYMNYTGGVINTSGDVQYDVLKSLENGAALYFLLSYQNSNEFKNAFQMGLNDNYSVNYETWRDDVVYYYNQLNGAIGSLQNATITDHGFVNAYRANTEIAGFIFAQSNTTQKIYADTEAEYRQTILAVDDAVKRGANNAKELWDKEISLLKDYNETMARAEMEEAFSGKEKIANVVYVTYTADNGDQTTFYINYNSFDVAIELNGGIYTLAAESFVNANDKNITVTPVEDYTYETIEVLMPTAGQLERYQTAKENYDSVMADGNSTASQKNKAKGALENAINAIQKTSENTVKLTAEDGSVGYFNYEQATVLVRISDTEYKVIASQSYVID
jgi:biopolymer transport protein ExbD